MRECGPCSNTKHWLVRECGPCSNTKHWLVRECGPCSNTKHWLVRECGPCSNTKHWLVRECGPCSNTKHWFTTSFKVPESGAGSVSEGCGPCPVSSNLLLPGRGHNTDSTVLNWVMTSVIPDGQLAQASIFIQLWQGCPRLD